MVSQLQGMIFDPGVLEYSTTYYWKVVPYNAIGDAENCPVWQFTTLIGDAIENMFHDMLVV